MTCRRCTIAVALVVRRSGGSKRGVSGTTFDVFISYGSEDRGWADRLAGDLEDEGIATFLDDQRLVPGSNWRSDLQAAVTKSRHLVMLYGPSVL